MLTKETLLSKKVNGRRHSKLFTNCHASWDTLYPKVSLIAAVAQKLISVYRPISLYKEFNKFLVKLFVL